MDGIEIHATLEDKGVTEGVKNIKKSLSRLKDSVNTAFAIGVDATYKTISTAKAALLKFGSFAAAFLRKALLGVLVLFALSFRQIISSIRDSMGELINIRGGKLKDDVDAIKNKFTELRATIAAAFLPLLEIAIPYIKLALDWLIQLLNKVAMVTAAFAGQKEVLQVIPGSAAKLAKSTKETEKAAKNILAAFDQINVLQKEKPDENPATVEAQMVPITNDILSKVQQIKDEIAAWWADPIGKLQETWGRISDWFRQNVAEPIKQWWKNSLFGQWVNEGIASIKTLFSDLWTVISDDNLTLTEKIKAVWGILTTWFRDNITLPWSEHFRIFAEFAKAWIVEIVNWIRERGAALYDAFSTTLDRVGQKFREVFNGIRDFVVSVINDIVAVVAGMVASILESVGLLNTLNPSAPNVGGATGSVTLPHLATGAVIPPNARFAAILGDQRSGTNIEAPADLIRQIVREELSGSSGGDITIPINLDLDGEVVYKTVKKIERRRGTSLVAGGVTG